ncbi:Guanylate kinase [termite gut metagenome]|jgi:guanylate kinase|uniref:Guanylate kinase n=1 Tax=termite gut metagenome TaxID=433724 RepID=A0A5J4S3S2_9ZZZZ
MSEKVIILSAPSGSGKTSIVKYLLQKIPDLSFSVSATSRTPRGKERDGIDYFFISLEEFHRRIDNDEFLEYEEVYKGCYYGTLKAQVEELLKSDRNVIFDVDVVGACNIKKYYGKQALSLFVQPPSIEELRNRLISRDTDLPETIENRIIKAEYELSFADKADRIIINETLEVVQKETLQLIKDFIKH